MGGGTRWQMKILAWIDQLWGAVGLVVTIHAFMRFRRLPLRKKSRVYSELAGGLLLLGSAVASASAPGAPWAVVAAVFGLFLAGNGLLVAGATRTVLRARAERAASEQQRLWASLDTPDVPDGSNPSAPSLGVQRELQVDETESEEPDRTA